MAKNRYDCSKCPGYCCSYDHIEVSDYDVRRLAKHFDLPEKTFRLRYLKTTPENTTVLRHRKDHIYKSMCVFFDQQERRCTVYSARPRVCRSYPNGNYCGYYAFIQFERDHQDDPEFIPSA
jgi:Fe-S-cluster containining protein